MKKTLFIILSFTIAVGVIVGMGILANAEQSEVFILSDVTVNEETHLTLEDMGISDFVSQIREHFPQTIEQKYENGVLSIPNVQAVSASYYSFADYNNYEMTLVDGYWTIEIDESVYNDGFGLIRYYGTDEEWQAIYRQGEMECITIAFSQARVVQIYPTFTTFLYVNSDDLQITNEYDLDGALTINSVRFDSNDLVLTSYYNSNKEFKYAEILVNGSFYYYLSNQGWSSNYHQYLPIDPPQGWEEVDDKYFMNITPCTIICKHTEWTDETETVCAGCGKEYANINGVKYEVVGDITNTGLNINWYGTQSGAKVCYKAGDGYVVAEYEKYHAQIILYNATIDVRELEDTPAIYTNINDVQYIIYGTNNIYGNDTAAIDSSGGSGEDSEAVMNGIDGAILNVYGLYNGNYLTINSGTVNVYYTKESNSYVIAVDLLKGLVINEGATLTAFSSGSLIGLNIGVWTVRNSIKNNGTLNAIVLEMQETDNKIIYNLVVRGDVLLVGDMFNPFREYEIPEGFDIEMNLIIPEGTSLTVLEGVTLDLDSITNADVQGKIIVEGTLICTHKGGEATCTEDAICEVCKLSYVESFGHSFKEGKCTVCEEADPDFVIEVEPTPSEPAQQNWFMKFIYAVTDFFKRLAEIIIGK